MFEKFTDRARQVIVLAQEEARLLLHDYIGTEHLLLGLVDQGDGIAGAALTGSGVTAEAVRHQVGELIGRGLEPPSGHIPFTPRAKRTLELAMRESLRHGSGHIGTEHLLLGMIHQDECVAVRIIATLGADPDHVRQQVLQLMASAPPPSPPGPPATEMLTASAPPGPPATAMAFSGSATVRPPGFAPATIPAFDRFARPVTATAITGRDEEIGRLVRALSRRTRNNAVLIGEPCTGRLTIAAALAARIADGSVPPPLRDRKLYAVEFDLLVAAAVDRADAERRTLSLLTQIQSRGDVIVLTADLAPLDGSAGAHAAVVAGFVRAALLRQELQLITTSSAAGYERALVRDPRLVQVFQSIPVATPTAEEAIPMLAAARLRLEEHHRVRITDEALAEAVRLAASAPGEPALPASAVDLLDGACAWAVSQPEPATEVGEEEVRRARAA